MGHVNENVDWAHQQKGEENTTSGLIGDWGATTDKSVYKIVFESFQDHLHWNKTAATDNM